MPFRRVVFPLLLALACVPSAFGVRHRKKRNKPPKEYFLFRFYPELKPAPPVFDGESPSLIFQNRIADHANLPRVLDSAQLHLLETQLPPYLVPFPDRISCFVLDKRIGRRTFTVPVPGSRKKRRLREDFRYANPDVIDYLKTEFVPHFCRNFARPLKISSLVRTEEYQRYLARRNGSARQALGDNDDNRSAHLTGYAFDISTKGLNALEIMRLAECLLLEKRGGHIAEVIVEPNNRCFHIMVRPRGWYHPPIRLIV